MASVRYPALTGSRYEHALGTMHLAAAGWQSAWRLGDDGVRVRFAREVIGELRAVPDPDPCTSRWVAGVTRRGHRAVARLLPGRGPGRRRRRSPPRPRPPAVLPRPRGLLPSPDRPGDGGGGGRRPGTSTPRPRATGSSTSGRACRSSTPCRTSASEHLPRTFVRLVLSDREGNDWAHCLHGIIDGQFDVDRLDYLMRDGLRAGTELGSIDCATAGGEPRAPRAAGRLADRPGGPRDLGVRDHARAARPALPLDHPPPRGGRGRHRAHPLRRGRLRPRRLRARRYAVPRRWPT